MHLGIFFFFNFKSESFTSMLQLEKTLSKKRGYEPGVWYFRTDTNFSKEKWYIYTREAYLKYVFVYIIIYFYKIVRVKFLDRVYGWIGTLLSENGAPQFRLAIYIRSLPFSRNEFM